jgi:PAS domain S-box-containing protein
MAALFLAPRRDWWLYLLAVSPVHIFVQMQDNVPGWGIISQLAGNFGQALLAAITVRYFENGLVRIDNFRGALVFSLCAVLFAPVSVSSIASYLYVLSGWEEDYWYVWRARVLSNALSTLTIVPFIMAGASAITQPRQINTRRLLEAGLLAIGVVLIAVMALRQRSEFSILLYATLPMLLWAAIRFGVGGLCLSILVTSYIMFLDASVGHGPFTTKTPVDNVLSLQLFLITISLPLLLLAALTQERRDKEQALRESEARYRALVMASTDMVWRASADGVGLFIEPSWQRLTGQNELDMRAFGWLDAVHPDDREQSRRLWQQAVAEKSTYENELRVRTRSGNYRSLYSHAVPVLTSDGRVHEWVGTNTDITERRDAEKALRESEERLARTETFSLVMVTHTDLEGRWRKVPPTLCQLLGYTEEELLSRRFHDITHPDDIDANLTQRLRLLRGEIKSFDLEERYIRKDGVIVWVYVNVSIVTDAEGTPVHFLGYIRDITDRKRAQAELQVQRAELAHVARISTMGELAAALAHELNQPLTAILSNAQAAQRFLAASPVDLDEVREILKDIVQDNNRAGEVIRRMRTLVKKEEFVVEPLDLRSTIEEVVQLVHSDAILRNLQLSLQFDEGLPPVRGDKVQLQQVVLNLLLNAFDSMKDRFDGQRQVVLRTELEGLRMAKVAVSDHGTGLPTGNVDRIFQLFYTSKPDGLGVGLSICRSIIEAHGGRLWAENNADRGATFYFTVPVEGRSDR